MQGGDILAMVAAVAVAVAASTRSYDSKLV